MRRARWLILAAIIIIVFGVGSTYYGRLARMAKDAPPPPTPLKDGIDASAEAWHYRTYDEKRRGTHGEPCPPCPSSRARTTVGILLMPSSGSVPPPRLRLV